MPLQVTSKFDPFTFEELAKPISQATAVHSELENEYSQLMASSAQVAQYLDPTDPGDRQLLNIYGAYAKKLNDSAGTLANKGVNPSMIKDLTKLKSIYASSIAPIENAYKAKVEQMKSQRDAKQKDSSMQFTYDAGSMPVSFYYANPGVNYNGISLNGITKRVGEIAKGYTKQLLHNPTDWGLTAGGQQIERWVSYGLNDADIQRALNGEDKMLGKIIMDAVQQSGAQGYGDNVLKMAIDAAADGLRQGFGEMKSERVTYDPYRIPLSEQRLRNAKLDEIIKTMKIRGDYIDGDGTGVGATGGAVNIGRTVNVVPDKRNDKVNEARMKAISNDGMVNTLGDYVELARSNPSLDMSSLESGATGINKQSLDALITKYGLPINPDLYNDNKTLAEAVYTAINNEVESMNQTRLGEVWQPVLDNDISRLLSSFRIKLTNGSTFTNTYNTNNKKMLSMLFKIEKLGNKGGTGYYKNIQEAVDDYNEQIKETKSGRKLTGENDFLDKIFSSNNADMTINSATQEITITDHNTGFVVTLNGALTPLLGELGTPHLYTEGNETIAMSVPMALDIMTQYHTSKQQEIMIPDISPDGEMYYKRYTGKAVRNLYNEAQACMSDFCNGLNNTEYLKSAKTNIPGSRRLSASELNALSGEEEVNEDGEE